VTRKSEIIEMAGKILAIVAVIMALLFTGTATAAPEQTATGFIYPTGVKEPYSWGQWLAGAPGKAYYPFACCYHIGQDIMAAEGASVFPIADGEFIYVSIGIVNNGWNSVPEDGNYGLFVKHKLNTGEEFVALYGHVRPNSADLKYTLSGTVNPPIKVDPPVKVYVGVGFATVGHYSTGSHLHFGIHPGAALPASPWGRMPIDQPGANGFVDPIDWIKTKQPAGSIPVTSWSFNTAGDKEGWEAHYVESSEVGTDGKYRINPSIDPWIQRDFLALDAASYSSIEINMASNAPDGTGKIYFTTKDSPVYGDDKYIQFQVTNDGNWKTYTVSMAGHSLWKGIITGLRIDPALAGKPGTDNTDIIGFDWIKTILEPASIAIMFPNGGELWSPSSPSCCLIQWTATGNPGTWANVELLKNGNVVSGVGASVLINSGSITLAVPTSQTPGSDYKIRITSLDNPSYTDISSGNFVIGATPTPTPIPPPPPYDPDLEGAMVTNGVDTLPWLLKNNFRQRVADLDTFWIIYNSNGKRYGSMSDANINKIPQGPDIKLP
jgi:hypothetical protein